MTVRKLIAIEKPVYTHDCDKCIYLGTYTDRKDQNYDCYVCIQGRNQNSYSILGRYGSDGPEYISSHPPEAFAMGQDYLHFADGWYLFALLQMVRLGHYKINY